MLNRVILIFIVLVAVSACAGGPGTTKKEREQVDNKSAAVTNLQLGVGYIKRGQYEIAEEKLGKAIKQDPRNIEAYTAMAYLMTLVNQNERAEDYYQDALDIKENNPETLNSYGAFLCKVGRLDEAMEKFRQAATNPFYETPYLAYNNAGTCLLEAKNYKNAEYMLRNALKQQPELQSALLSMAEIGVKTKKYLMARAYVQRFHAVAKPTAESLWVQVQAEKALGDKEHYLKYAKQLLNQFPDSKQAKLVEKLASNDRQRK